MIKASRLLYFLLPLFFVIACSSNENGGSEAEKTEKVKKSKRTLPQSTGTKAELIIVCEDSIWKGQAGKHVQKIFQKEQFGLNGESYFDVFHVSKKDFRDVLVRNRSLIVFEKSDTNRFRFLHDVHARPQRLALIEYTHSDSLIQMIRRNLPATFDRYREMDLDIIRGNLRSKTWDLPPLFAQEKIDFILPRAFQISAEDDQTVVFWSSSAKSDIVMFVHIRPMAEEYDRQYEELVIHWRDSLSKIHIQADAEGSYTTTEKDPFPQMKFRDLNDMLAIETRGYYKSVGDYMGGSFLNFTYLDEKNQRIIIADGLIYAPNQRKRNPLLDLEALLTSIRIN